MSDERLMTILKCLASGFAGSFITAVIFSIFFSFVT